MGLDLMQELPRRNSLALATHHGFEVHHYLLQHITTEGDVDPWGDKHCKILLCSEVYFKTEVQNPFRSQRKIPYT